MTGDYLTSSRSGLACWVVVDSPEYDELIDDGWEVIQRRDYVMAVYDVVLMIKYDKEKEKDDD